MTSLLNIAGNIPVSGVEEGQSLRFEDGDSAYLNRTPASAGNRKTWTWSGWVKRGNLTTNQRFFEGRSSTGDSLLFNTSDQINFWHNDGSSSVFTTTAVFRDVGAWYHIVLSVDTTQATSTDRVKLYVNNVQQTFSSSTYPSLNYQGHISNTVSHVIGRHGTSTQYFDGYLANVTFIDGQALTPASFGEYDDTLWKPKSDTDIQALTFGTNGFYLPFKQTTEAEGFSTVTYTGNGSQQSIEGVGFEPDFVWLKNRDVAYQHGLYDSVRGASKHLETSQTDAEETRSGVTSFDSNGFTLGSDNLSSYNGSNYVAWCWDAGTGSAVSNTDGSITSSVKANTANGFSIVSYTGTGTAGDTIGHGLTASAPDMIIVKSRTEAVGWYVYHSSATSDPENRFLRLDTTAAVSGVNDGPWDSTAPSASVITLGDGGSTNRNTEDYVAYCFHSVSGYSSIGSYSGTGATGNSITGLGFKPAWVMTKRTDSTSNWVIRDNTRDPVNPRENRLFPNSSSADSTGNDIDFDSDGFTLQTTSGDNVSGGTYIYMAFADTRDATFFGDTSGNGNNWTPNALNNTDVLPDSPVSGGNFAVLNELSNSDSVSLKEGSLEFTADTSSRNVQGTMAVSSGKWYFEARMLSGGSAGNGYNVGVATAGCANITTNPSAASGGIPSGEALNAVDSRQFFYSNDGGTNTVTSNSTAFVAGDIIGVALDLDSATQTVAFYKNGTIIGSAQTLAHQDDTWLPHLYSASFTNTPRILNFGQDSSFAGNETPQGNTDDNGQGDFYYAPPSGFLALTTGNLPAATITAPDEYFDTTLYTGNAGNLSITSLQFQPDFVWGKLRTTSSYHRLHDVARGSDNTLATNVTDAEVSGNGIVSFDSNGWTMDSGTNINQAFNYVAWSWKAGGTAVSNTDGSITSQVSANTDAGFSIATYSGNGTAGATIGHGLTASVPEMIIVKDRTATGFWAVYHSGNTSAPETDLLRLNTTNATLDGSVYWNDTAPTSSVFTVGTSSTVNNSSRDYVAYCFHSVEGYSKIGSYTGNGSSDGPFVHCGFRPAFILTKRTDTGGFWWEMVDATREPVNPSDQTLYANVSDAEYTSSVYDKDLLSNGFKIRGTNGGHNASGGSYIFMAFAEAPFKSANAR